MILDFVDCDWKGGTIGATVGDLTLLTVASTY